MWCKKKRRRDSLKVAETPIVAIDEDEGGKDYFDVKSKTTSHSRKRSLSLEEFRQQMGASSTVVSPFAVASPSPVNGSVDKTMKEEEESDRSELFANVQKPRVRYDVEVVTKLIVYTGIAWFAG